MVEVLIPSSVVNRSLLPDFNADRRGLVYQEDAFAAAVSSVYDDRNEYLARALLERVRLQVEWYFSDENLRKDAFLMKHIARNKRGFVSLKLVASLRKVKAITKDCQLVADSIKNSELLELNEDETKVRRIEAIPDVDYSCIPKTIIITNHQPSNEEPQVSQIHKEYSRYGDVSRITVLVPGKAAIPLYVKSCKTRFPCIGKEVCVLVEYASVEMAKKACKECRQNWRQTANVQLLSATQQTDEPATKFESPADRTPPSSSDKKMNKRRLSPDVSSSRSSGKQSNNKTGSANSSSTNSLLRHKSPSNCSDSGYSVGASRSPSASPKSSPAPVRRFFNDTTLVVGKQSLVNVVRNPLGPDGTKGFHSLQC